MRIVEALRARMEGGLVPIVPDIKAISPKEGDLMRGRSPVDVACALADAGAPALSVVTESARFGGSLSMMEAVVRATGLPVLRKDFLTTRAQVAESAGAGAAAVLLIAAMLTDRALIALCEEARRQNVDALIEVHDAREVERANALAPSFLGINNRDILALERDDGAVDTTERLAGLVRARPFILCESGIGRADDVRRARRAGASGVLIGTAILAAPDAVAAYREFAEVPL